MDEFKYSKLCYKIENIKKYASFSKSYGYAHLDIEGQFSDELYKKLGRWPTEEEAIALIDNNRWNFGAMCCVHSDGSFYGRINID